MEQVGEVLKNKEDHPPVPRGHPRRSKSRHTRTVLTAVGLVTLERINLIKLCVSLMRRAESLPVAAAMLLKSASPNLFHALALRE